MENRWQGIGLTSIYSENGCDTDFLTDFLPHVMDFPHTVIGALITPSYCYIAAYDDFGYPYRLADAYESLVSSRAGEGMPANQTKGKRRKRS